MGLCKCRRWRETNEELGRFIVDGFVLQIRQTVRPIWNILASLVFGFEQYPINKKIEWKKFEHSIGSLKNFRYFNELEQNKSVIWANFYGGSNGMFSFCR